MRECAAGLALLLCAAAGLAHADELNGNVSQNGVRKDLAWMQQVGIGD